jgi:hypothetical protein
VSHPYGWNSIVFLSFIPRLPGGKSQVEQVSLLPFLQGSSQWGPEGEGGKYEYRIQNTEQSLRSSLFHFWGGIDMTLGETYQETFHTSLLFTLNNILTPLYLICTHKNKR